MAKREAALLDQIEADAVNGRPIADTLRKAVILGGQAGSTTLREWAIRELKGYGPDDELPGYRTIRAPLCRDAVVGRAQIRGQQISPGDLPDFAQDEVTNDIRLRMGIGEIAALIRDHESRAAQSVQLTPAGAADLVKYMNFTSSHPSQLIMALYWDVSTAVLNGVVDQVRTSLAELVAEMRAGTPEGKALPSPDVTNQAVSVAIHGRNARVTVTNQTSGGDAIAATATPPTEGLKPGWWTTGRIAWSALIGVAGIAAAWFAYLEWQG